MRIGVGRSRRIGLFARLQGSENPSLFNAPPDPSSAPRCEGIIVSLARHDANRAYPRHTHPLRHPKHGTTYVTRSEQYAQEVSNLRDEHSTCYQRNNAYAWDAQTHRERYAFWNDRFGKSVVWDTKSAVSALAGERDECYHLSEEMRYRLEHAPPNVYFRIG